MLNKNYEILCKLNLSHNNITVNGIIRAVNNELRNAAVQIICKTINDVQNAILNKFLGTKWNEFDTILIDGTKVKSGFKERGSDIHLVIDPIKKIDKYGRKYNEKRIVAFSIGKSYKGFKKQLFKYSCKNVIADGESAYSSIIKDIFADETHRRCIWHIPRQLFHLLYMNKVPVKDREVFYKL